MGCKGRKCGNEREKGLQRIKIGCIRKEIGCRGRKLGIEGEISEPDERNKWPGSTNGENRAQWVKNNEVHKYR